MNDQDTVVRLREDETWKLETEARPRHEKPHVATCGETHVSCSSMKLSVLSPVVSSGRTAEQRAVETLALAYF